MVINAKDAETLRLRFEHLKNYRYYDICLQQDLFQHWCITRVWGRKNSMLGQIRHYYYADYELCLDEIRKIKKERMRRGYQLLTNHTTL